MTSPPPSDRMLDRYLAGESSPAERAEVESWIHENPAREKRFQALPTLLVANDFKREWNVDAAYSRVDDEIRRWARQVDVTWLYNIVVGARANWKPLALAASLLIVAATSLTIRARRDTSTVAAASQWKQSRTALGETKRIALTDGSTIDLGPNSTLRYSEQRNRV